MARLRKENPRYNVISMRISEEERKHLDDILTKTHTSVSHFMRDAMNYFASIHESGVQKHKAA